MKKLLKAIFAISFLILMIGLSFNLGKEIVGIAPPPGSYTITCSGQVNDLDTGLALANAKVKLFELETGIQAEVITSSKGTYSISISTYSYIKYTLKVERENYQPQTQTYYSPGTYSYTFNLYHQLHTISCSGYVRDINTGAPVADGTITLKELGTGTTKTTKTNWQGSYGLYLQTTSFTSYKLEFKKTGYTSLTKTYNSPGSYTFDFNVNAIYTTSCSGYVYIDNTSRVLKDATIRLFDSNNVLLSSEITNSNGYFSIHGTTYASDDFELEITNFGYQTQRLFLKDGTNNNINVYLMPNDYSSEKLGFFFYDSNFNIASCMEYYAAIMEIEGFTITLYEDICNLQTIMEEIDILEGESDYIFLYFSGHGSNENGFSEVRINTALNVWVSTILLATYIDKLESNNIFIVVDSCYSGGFVDDLQGENRFIISSSTSDQLSVCNIFTGPVFSGFFFYNILNFQCDTIAFLNAAIATTAEVLLLAFHLQIPQYNDQLPETWFLL